jgi:hypothetical protein
MSPRSISGRHGNTRIHSRHPTQRNPFSAKPNEALMLPDAALQDALLEALGCGSDRSKKGSFDAPINDMLSHLNMHPDYMSTSSCSACPTMPPVRHRMQFLSPPDAFAANFVMTRIRLCILHILFQFLCNHGCAFLRSHGNAE